MINVFIHKTIQQKKLYNINEMNPTMLILKILILKHIMNCHCLWSTVERCGH